MTDAQYRSPTGAMIVGVAYTVAVTFFIAGIEEDGTPDLQSDEHEIHRPTLKEKLVTDQLAFVDENQEGWTFDQLTRVDPEATPYR